MKKYEINKDGRCVALIDFFGVEKGTVGGYVEKEENLQQEGDAWVSGDAQVSGNAQLLTFYGVGSEYKTLTAFPSKYGYIIITRGCFIGTVDEFVKAVKAKHGDSDMGKEYMLLVEMIKIRFKNLKAEKEKGV